MRKLLVCIALCASACEPGNGIDALQLRPSVRTVLELPVVDHACLTDSGCPRYVVPTIRDVAREGAIVAVLYTYPRWSGDYFEENAGLVFSLDDGETWTSPQLTGDGGVSGAPAGVVVRDGAIYLLSSLERIGAMGDTYVDLHSARVDPATGVVSYVGRIVTDLVVDAMGSLWSYDYYPPNPVFVSSWAQWDVTTAAQLDGAAETLVADPEERYCPPGGAWRGFVGPSGWIGFLGGCHQPDGSYCMGYAAVPERYAPGRWRPRFTCVADWPVPEGTLEMTLAAGGTRALEGAVLYTEESSAGAVTRAAFLDASGGVPEARTVDIGPGSILYRIADTASNVVGVDRPRFGGLVALVEPLPDESVDVTLYRPLTTGAFERTSLPTRACDPGAYCGYLPLDHSRGLFLERNPSTLQWALPLPDDEWLLFYVVDVMRPSSGQHQNVIFVSRERLDRGPGESASPLETACVRASACALLPFSVPDCVRRWMQAEVTDARRAELAAATTCEELRRLEPLIRNGEACSFDEPRCEGDLGVSCLGVAGLSVFADCRESGGGCEPDPVGGVRCSFAGSGCPDAAWTCDAAGRAVLCGPTLLVDDCAARGLECQPGACVTTGSECAGLSPGAAVCAGDLYGSCTMDGRVRPVVDCSLVPGLTCDPGQQCTGDGACDLLTPSRCEGTHLRYCLFGSLRDVDCASLGLRCGEDGAGSAACVAGSP